MPSLLVSLLALSALIPSLAPAIADTPSPRDVTIPARDAVALTATYYAAATPGPAVLLLHMCNSNRTSWEPVGRQLSAAGIHALAIDYRGFGESGGERYETQPPEGRRRLNAQWPDDVDTALAYLQAQPGVDKAHIGAGGGSCGVQQAVQAARRHPEIVSLVLLAGPTNRAGQAFLQQTTWLPVFASAAADDQFDVDAPQAMQWLTEISANPRNRFVGFADGKHGTEIFGPHPELPRQIVDWFVDTLVKAPSGPNVAVTPRRTPAAEFWTLLNQPGLNEPGGMAKAVQMFRDARRRDPRAQLFPETELNLAGYERLQAGQHKQAIALFTLNVEAFPTSANAQDSLSDGYLADGQNELALAAAKTSLEMLHSDTRNQALSEAIRRSAEEKIQKLTGAARQ